jgi:hypothetical protein
VPEGGSQLPVVQLVVLADGGCRPLARLRAERLARLPGWPAAAGGRSPGSPGWPAGRRRLAAARPARPAGRLAGGGWRPLARLARLAGWPAAAVGRSWAAVAASGWSRRGSWPFAGCSRPR